MPVKTLFGLAAAGLVLVPSSRAAGYAGSVIQYNSGTGFTPGYTNSSAALGEPSRVTPGQFGGPVDPFNPPYLSEQIVSIGAGGSLTLRFDTAAANDPANPWGIDFIVFGHSGFTIVNGDFNGGGITDGSLFTGAPGESRVSVSADGITFYELTPSLAPAVDLLFPTDGSGNFHTPVDPSLTRESFAGKSLSEIRALYRGSSGGTGFDISWARTSGGQPVDLSSIQYVRIDVLNGSAAIDGIAVVPEPSTYAIFGAAAGALFLFCRSDPAHRHVKKTAVL